jgi:hypothetical protein
MSPSIFATWSCHVCGEERADERISVYSENHSVSGVTAKYNVRYCNDRPACRAGAPDVAAMWRGEPVNGNAGRPHSA